ncbi:MATE efflux family protein (plasmid) [Thermus thermophilus SG0.5JP17-16]|uniref:Multidrug-efflux transporter n=2 Tax=Thermus TaxID=270 RepID=F6DIW8_THETG|nr:MATE family efflux transporter [Thermus thermophilus]AEG34365.1 MATE efflux family protein [Thermus thermophilus SG0.5JP17-16]
MTAMAERWRSILGLALPIIGASLVEIILGLVDTAFLGRLGAGALAAVATASALYSVVVQVVATSAIGYQILAARAFGASDRARVDALYSNAVVLVAAVAALGVLLLFFSLPLLRLIASTEEVAQEALLFLRIRSPSLLFFALGLALRSTLYTAKQAHWVFRASVLSVSANIVLDYLLIFGKLGLPAMGTAGAALASTIATLLGYMYLYWVHLRLKLAAFLPRAAHAHGVREQLRLSGPEMANAFLDYVGTAVLFLFMGQLGTYALAGGRIGFTLLLFFFALAFGLGFAVQILVGHHLGAGRTEDFRKDLHAGHWLGVPTFLLLGFLTYLAREPLALVFTSSPEVVAEAVQALIPVALSLPLMAATMVEVGGLRALGYTQWNMYSNLAVIWFVQMPVAWLLGVKLGLGLEGVFAGFVAYFGVRWLVTHVLLNRGLRRISQADTVSQ